MIPSSQHQLVLEITYIQIATDRSFYDSILPSETMLSSFNQTQSTTTTEGLSFPTMSDYNISESTQTTPTTSFQEKIITSQIFERPTVDLKIKSKSTPEDSSFIRTPVYSSKFDIEDVISTKQNSHQTKSNSKQTIRLSLIHI